MSQITEIVRNLRKNSTPAEIILWEKLRNHKFMSFKFKRQEPIIFNYDNRKWFFVADFLCPEHKVVIELDGKIHDYQKEHDIIRDEILITLGYYVVRINNDEVLNNINNTLIKLKRIFNEQKMKNEITASPQSSHQSLPHPGPLQRRGRGREAYSFPWGEGG